MPRKLGIIRKLLCLILSLLFLAGSFAGISIAEEESETTETDTVTSETIEPTEEKEETTESEESTEPAESIESAGSVESAEEEAETPESEESTETAEGVYYQLSSTEVIVYDYNDLKTALANDNGITKVYFGADITMTGGIQISSKKTSLEISGLNPENPTQTTPYTLTDYSSSLYNYTIYVSGTIALSTLKFSDLNIIGKNYYGTFCAYGTHANLVVTYERVTYSGPQMIYHRGGTSHLIDCSVSIHSDNGGSAKQEFAEAKHLIFEGNNTINTTTSTNSVFWMPTGGTFTIKDGSSLEVRAMQLSSYGVYYADGVSYTIDVEVGENASYRITTSHSLDNDNASFSSFTVKDGGAFYMNTTTSATHVMNMRGNLKIGEGASFIINSSGGSGYVIYQRAAGSITVSKNATFHLIASGGGTALMQLYSGGSLICTDPASALLYNPSGRVIQSASSTCSISIDAQQVNDWTTAGSGGLDNPPAYHWQNACGNVSIAASVVTAGATTVNSHTYSGTVTVPNSTTFSMASARVLSFGRLELTVNELHEASASITGTTAPGAAIRASYVEAGGSSIVLADVTAGNNGSYSVFLTSALAQETQVTVKAAFQYLFAEKSTAVKEGPGEITGEYTVSLSLDSSAAATWNDLGGNVAATFASGSAKLTAIFSQEITKYTGYPENSSSSSIAILDAGTWTVTLYLPVGYDYTVYKNDTPSGKSLTISDFDATDCRIEIVVFKVSEPPWGKHLLKSANS